MPIDRAGREADGGTRHDLAERRDEGRWGREERGCARPRARSHAGHARAGAVAGALLLSRIRWRVRPDALTVAGTLLFAGASLRAGLVPAYWAVLALMLVAGAAWVSAISTSTARS
jgi:hypothetical protein